MQKLLTFFFQQNISGYAIFNDKSFNDTLTNDIVSFEQVGQGITTTTIPLRKHSYIILTPLNPTFI